MLSHKIACNIAPSPHQPFGPLFLHIDYTGGHEPNRVAKPDLKDHEKGYLFKLAKSDIHRPSSIFCHEKLRLVNTSWYIWPGFA